MKALPLLIVCCSLLIASLSAQQKITRGDVREEARGKQTVQHSAAPKRFTEAQVDSIKTFWRTQWQEQLRRKSYRLVTDRPPTTSKHSILKKPTKESEKPSLTVQVPEKLTVYQVPFSSQGNSIELSISNASSVTASSITIQAKEYPSWLQFTSTAVSFSQLNAGEEKAAFFSFRIDRAAPVNKEETITFTVTAKTGETSQRDVGQTRTKQIKIQVAPPERFEVFQNYPNPFNPLTAIGYQLATVSRVTLKVYNGLGQEVAILSDGEQQPGYHQATFDASRLASGMYIYQVQTTDDKGEHHLARKKMMVLK